MLSSCSPRFGFLVSVLGVARSRRNSIDILLVLQRRIPDRLRAISSWHALQLVGLHRGGVVVLAWLQSVAILESNQRPIHRAGPISVSLGCLGPALDR
ncbi:hypothetical protein BDV18DRAFT_144589 [Aspergillus unguis]